MRRLRDILLVIGWVACFAVALDVWQTAHRIDNELTELAAEIWLIAMLIGGLVGGVTYIRIVRWNRRFESDRCPACGYDLRATRDRCPECSWEASPQESGSLPAFLHATALDHFRRQQDQRPAPRASGHS